jgi:hypothetical protein
MTAAGGLTARSPTPMENNLPRLPASGHYTARWKAAKAKFKETTGKKKPAPTKVTKLFSDKIATIEKRQGTGIDKAIVALEKALPGLFQSEKGLAAYDKAFDDYRVKVGQYLEFLEAAVKTAPNDVSPQVWKQAVVALKVETQRIKLELTAYLDKAKQSERAASLAQDMAANMFHALAPLVTTAEKWVLERMHEKQINELEFTNAGRTNARNITQRLSNMHKLPILVGGWQTGRGPVPDHVEDTLEGFANGRRTYANQQEYIAELNEYRIALRDLKEWIG